MYVVCLFFLVPVLVLSNILLTFARATQQVSSSSIASLLRALATTAKQDGGGGVFETTSTRRRFFTAATTTSSLLMNTNAPAAVASSSAAVAMTTMSTADPAEYINWGLVGLGDVTAKKSGPPFYKCTGSTLAAAMRRTPGKAAAWAQRVPGGQCRGYEQLDTFFAHRNEDGDGGLDAIYVATRPGTHLQVSQQVVAAAVEHGITAVYVEKPVGRCAAETLTLAEAARNANVKLYTAYISRAYERTQALRNLLTEGVIGDCVQSVDYQLVDRTGGARDMEGETPWRLNATQAGGGLVMDVGCHVLDRIDYLFGPLENVQGEATNMNSPHQNVQDYVSLQATIGAAPWASINSKGATVRCVWNFSGQTSETRDRLVITGPKGSIQCAGMSPCLPITVLDAQGKQVQELTFAEPEHTAQPMIQAITDELRGIPTSSPYMISTAENAIRTSQVLDKVLDGYYGGREIGYWERPETWPGRPSEHC